MEQKGNPEIIFHSSGYLFNDKSDIRDHGEMMVFGGQAERKWMWNQKETEKVRRGREASDHSKVEYQAEQKWEPWKGR